MLFWFKYRVYKVISFNGAIEKLKNLKVQLYQIFENNKVLRKIFGPCELV